MIHFRFDADDDFAAPAPHTARTTLLVCGPNPFARGGATAIEVRIGGVACDEATLTLHDGAGRLVRTLRMPADAGGECVVSWDGKNAIGELVPEGVYCVRLRAGAVIRLATVVVGPPTSRASCR